VSFKIYAVHQHQYKEKSLAQDTPNLFLILFLKHNKNSNSVNNKDNERHFNQPVLIALVWLYSF